jgi:hypothetical protein
MSQPTLTPGVDVFDLSSAERPDSYFFSELDADGNFMWAVAIGDVAVEGRLDISVYDLVDLIASGSFIGLKTSILGRRLSSVPVQALETLAF